MLRLMEMIAIACYDIAAFLFHSVDGGLHKGTQIWRRDPSTLRLLLLNVEPPPTVFFRKDYDAIDQYPQGGADMVGYWAEYRIFGGVVLFDRGESEIEVCSSLQQEFRVPRIFPKSITHSSVV